jgi:hypothetical protein
MYICKLFDNLLYSNTIPFRVRNTKIIRLHISIVELYQIRRDLPIAFKIAYLSYFEDFWLFLQLTCHLLIT